LTCGVCGCTNEAGFEFKAKNDATRNCDWLSLGESEKRIKTYCKIPDIGIACTRICGNCHFDNENFQFETMNRNIRNCQWLSKYKERRQRYCTEPSVKNGCPASCFCEDNSEFKFITESGIKRNCKWLKKDEKSIDKYCKKATVENGCQETCGVCPVGGF
jgi:hypothetical protein